MAKLNCKASVGCLVRCGDTVVVVYEEQDGRGAWDIPAGGIEADESPEQAIRRELQEEIGLQVNGDLHLVKIFWGTLSGVSTVHFLYDLDIDEHTANALKTNTDDIQKIARFSRKEIQDLLDTNAYEHVLAKERLNLFLNDGYHDSASVQLV